MNTNSKYFLEKNFIIYLLGKIVSSVINLLSIPLFIKFFGIEEYGKFSLLYTTFLMLLAGGTGWISQGVLRFQSMEPDKFMFLREVNNLAIKAALIISPLLFIIFFYHKAAITTILVAMLGFFFACLYTVSITVLQSEFKSKQVIFVDIVRLFIYFVVPIFLHFTIPIFSSEINLFIGVLASYFFGFLMINGLSLLVLQFQQKISDNWSKKIWSYGSPLTFWMILSPSLNTSDRYIINFFLGVASVGQYSAVYEIIFKLYSQLAGPFSNIVQPLLINNHNKGNDKEFKVIMFRSGLYLTLMFLGLFIGVFCIKSFIIYSYLGFKGEVAIMLENIIVPLLISSFFWQISILLQKKIEIANKTISLLLYMGISVSIGIGFSCYFVPIYGYIASAYAMLLSSIFYFLIISKQTLYNEYYS